MCGGEKQRSHHSSMVLHSHFCCLSESNSGQRSVIAHSDLLEEAQLKERYWENGKAQFSHIKFL